MGEFHCSPPPPLFLTKAQQPNGDHVTEDNHPDSIAHGHVNGDDDEPCPPDGDDGPRRPDGDNGMCRHRLRVSFIAHHPLLCSHEKQGPRHRSQRCDNDRQ